MVHRASGLSAFCAIWMLTAAAAGANVDGVASFIFDGKRITIAQDHTAARPFAARFAALEPECDPACIVPAAASDAVTPVVEPDGLAFFEGPVAQSEGLVVDARMPDRRALGHVPGSVSMPYPALDTQNEFRGDILKALGARVFDGVYNFSDAQALVVYDGGPVSDDAGRLIHNLLQAGYPAEKLRYDRGGMQVWSAPGLGVRDQMA